MLPRNMFGDILSDAAAALVGSIGLIPSASFGSGAPLSTDSVGAYPCGKDSRIRSRSILIATVMLRDAFGLNLEAGWVEQSVVRVLSGGYRTPDLAGPGSAYHGRLHGNSARNCSVLWNTPNATAGVFERNRETTRTVPSNSTALLTADAPIVLPEMPMGC
jgi:3-isopropylmalate dehydrogenase